MLKGRESSTVDKYVVYLSGLWDNLDIEMLSGAALELWGGFVGLWAETVTCGVAITLVVVYWPSDGAVWEARLIGRGQQFLQPAAPIQRLQI